MHPRAFALTSLGALILAFSAAPLCARTRSPATAAGVTAPSNGTMAQKQPLTAADTVVLAGFENGTGDALFDDTLRQALALELEESPFVNVLGDRQVQAAVQAMGLPSGLTLTADVGRKVCARTHSKAVLQGAIARRGEGYRLDLVAADCATGAVLAHARSESPLQAGVLTALSQATASLRVDLGEPAASVQKYRAPVGTTTTALQAL